MPTLTIIILSGYFLGYPLAAIVVFVGILMAALIGYFLSFYCGERLLCVLLKNDCKRCEAIAAFNANGAAMIILARAMPILPELWSNKTVKLKSVKKLNKTEQVFENKQIDK